MKKKKSFFRRNFTLFSLAALLVAGLGGVVPTRVAHAASAIVCAAPDAPLTTTPTTLSGVVNAYYPGSNGSYTAGTTSLTVGAGDSRATTSLGQSDIKAGDLLLVIQIQNATIITSNNASYGGGGFIGSGATNLGTATAPGTSNAGVYEYVTVPVSGAQPIGTTVASFATGGTFTIVGNNAGGLINTYYESAPDGTTRGQQTFEVVRVPRTYNAILGTPPPTALSWNGSTGGLIIFDVANTLDLNTKTMSVDGKGFRGGAGRKLNGDTGGTPGTKSSPLDNYDFVTTSAKNYHGTKGEGIVGTPKYLYDPTVSKTTPTLNTNLSGNDGYPGGDNASGGPGNAGGGGADANPTANNRNSGGGGGSNAGFGGQGGSAASSYSNAQPSQIQSGGRGGATLQTQEGVSRLFFGGGGGAGVNKNGTGTDGSGNALTNGLASSGGAGGGTIMVRARYVVGTGTFTANGANAQNVGIGDLGFFSRIGVSPPTVTDGGGGGGAGGSIFVSSATQYMPGLTLRSGGGRGSDTNTAQAPTGTTPDGRTGPGGGGGGGFIIYSGTDAGNPTPKGNPGTTTNDPQETFDASTGGSGQAVFTTATPDIRGGAECLAADLTSNSTSQALLTSPGTDTFTIRLNNRTEATQPTSDPLGVALTISNFSFSFDNTILSLSATNPCVSYTGYELVKFTPVPGFTLSCGAPTVSGTTTTVPILINGLTTGTIPKADATNGENIFGLDLNVDIANGLLDGTPVVITTTADFSYSNGVTTLAYPGLTATSDSDNGYVGSTEFAARMAYVESSVSGSTATVKWATAMENNALGFNVYAVTPQGNQKLNQKIILAHSLLGKAASVYSATFTVPAGTTGVLVSDIEPGGKATQHGPLRAWCDARQSPRLCRQR